MEAVSFDDKGNPIDPKTGEKMNIDLPDEVKQHMAKKGTAVSSSSVKQKEDGAKLPLTELPKSYTKYEITPETNFKVDFCLSEVDGRVVVINEDEAEPGSYEKHWVTFKMWTYAQELDWKNKTTDFDGIKKVHFLNSDKLNEMKIRHLIREWSFQDTDPKFKLLHVNGVLSDESLEVFYGMYPTIIRFIVIRMNEILEYNG